jgi:hypothetical protein
MAASSRRRGSRATASGPRDPCRESAAFIPSARHGGRSRDSEPTVAAQGISLRRRLDAMRAESAARALFRLSAGKKAWKEGRFTSPSCGLRQSLRKAQQNRLQLRRASIRWCLWPATTLTCSHQCYSCDREDDRPLAARCDRNSSGCNKLRFCIYYAAIS